MPRWITRLAAECIPPSFADRNRALPAIFVNSVLSGPLLLIGKMNAMWVVKMEVEFGPVIKYIM